MFQFEECFNQKNVSSRRLFRLFLFVIKLFHLSTIRDKMKRYTLIHREMSGSWIFQRIPRLIFGRVVRKYYVSPLKKLEPVRVESLKAPWKIYYVINYQTLFRGDVSYKETCSWSLCKCFFRSHPFFKVKTFQSHIKLFRLHFIQ